MTLLAASKKNRKAAINPMRVASPGRTSKRREKMVVEKGRVTAYPFSLAPAFLQNIDDQRFLGASNYHVFRKRAKTAWIRENVLRLHITCVLFDRPQK
jgi:hypothetical protein